MSYSIDDYLRDVMDFGDADVDWEKTKKLLVDREQERHEASIKKQKSRLKIAPWRSEELEKE